MFARVVTDILATLRDYYRQPPVRVRMLEFLGADEAGDFTAEYITADTTDAAERTPLLPWELAVQLEAGSDICRSLADRDSLIAHLDIEYVNFDFPAEASETDRAVRPITTANSTSRSVFSDPWGICKPSFGPVMAVVALKKTTGSLGTSILDSAAWSL